MHLLGIAIHKIVERNETPSHARGSAAFSDGNIMEFHANLHYPKNYAITIIPPKFPGGFYPHSDFAAYLIHEELGLDKINRHEQAVVGTRQRRRHSKASFMRERIDACREFMTDDRQKLIAHYRNQLPDPAS